MQESILTLIQQVIRTNWEHLALTDFNGESLQYKDLGRKIAKLHLLFEHTGVKPGDKIAICGKNRVTVGCGLSRHTDLRCCGRAHTP